MSFPAPLHRYTHAEYIALEEHSPVRHEYVAGEIYAMAGGTPEHAALAATILRLVGNQLPAGCRAYTSDLRIRIPASDVTTYPDGAVVCGKTQRAADDPLAVTNPILIIEVTSASTETYDRGTKMEQYRLLPAVREVLIVSHREPRLTVWRRDDQTWTSTDARAGNFILAVEDVPVYDAASVPYGYLALAWSGTEYAASWTDERDGDREIYFSRIVCP